MHEKCSYYMYTEHVNYSGFPTVSIKREKKSNNNKKLYLQWTREYAVQAHRERCERI